MGWMVVHLFDIGMVMGSNLGRTKLNFLFAKILFGMEGKVIETLVVRGQLGGLRKWSWNSHWMAIKLSLMHIFVFSH